MNSFKIFFDRVKRDGVFQYNIIKSVADWTVLLYMIIPAVAIAVSIYCSWWRELPPWTEQLPFSLWASIAFLICLVPRYRTYVQEADSVFLVHHRSLFLSMKTWAYFYSIMKALLQMMLFIVAVLPFLLKVYSFTVTEVVSFACFYMAVLLVSMSVKAILFRRFSGWRRYLMGGGCVVFLLIMNGFLLKDLSTHLFFSSIILVLLIVVSFFLYYPRVKSTAYFQYEYAEENEERLRYMNLIFAASPTLEKPKSIKRKKPILYRHSRRIFKERSSVNGFIELFLKVILRNHEYLSGYYQLFSVTVIAVLFIPPLLFKVFIVIGYAIFIWIWLINLWNRILLSHPFGKQYEGNKGFELAQRKVCFYLTIIPTSILATVVMLAMTMF